MKKHLFTLLLFLNILFIGLTTAGQPASAATVKLNYTKKTIYTKKTVQLKLNNAKGTVKWESSNPSIAKVSSKGKVTGVKKGTVIIKAYNNDRVYSCTIKVKNPYLSVTSLELEPGEELLLKLTGATAEKYTTSYNDIADVDQEGRIYAKKAGEVEIVVRDSKDRTYNCRVTVKGSKTDEMADEDEDEGGDDASEIGYTRIPIDYASLNPKLADLLANADWGLPFANEAEILTSQKELDQAISSAMSSEQAKLSVSFCFTDFGFVRTADEYAAMNYSLKNVIFEYVYVFENCYCLELSIADPKYRPIETSTDGIDSYIADCYRQAGTYESEIIAEPQYEIYDSKSEVDEALKQVIANSSEYLYLEIWISNLAALRPMNEYMEMFPELQSIYIYEMERHPGAIFVVFGGIKKDQSLAEYEQAKDDLLQTAKDILACLELDGKSDIEKLAAVHDFLVLHTAYAYDEYLADEIPAYCYNAQGPLFYGKSVCAGYAAAFKLMVSILGFECKTQSGRVDAGRHAWNIVQLDGKWYHVDVTWDDPVPDMPGYVRYKYFLRSDEFMKRDHTWSGNIICDEDISYDPD